MYYCAPEDQKLGEQSTQDSHGKFAKRAMNAYDKEKISRTHLLIYYSGIQRWHSVVRQRKSVIRALKPIVATQN